MAIINEINEYNKRKVQPSVTSGNLAAQSQQLPSLVPGKASGGNSTPDVEDNPRGNISQYDSGNSPVVATPVIMNPREDERGGAPSASPAAIAGNSADDAGRITYESSGIAPTVTSGREYREDALRTMGEEEFKDVRKQMNASDKEYWTKQMEEHPESSYAILQNMFASDETPQEKSKRERREQLGQVFANLGNVIGNAANLYYAHRGGIPVDLNSGMMYENERMRRIKEKRDALKEKTDAILMNARLGDLAYARSVEDTRRKTEADNAEKNMEHLRKLQMKEIDDAYKRGLIGLQQKNALELQASKAKDSRELEAFKQRNRVALKNDGGGAGTKDKREIAYVTKYGDVSFDNPKNKRAATLSVLDVMKNGAPDQEKEKIDNLIFNMMNGDVDSYNKAEMYVSQHLNNDDVALKHLYELANKYGMVTSDKRQRNTRNKALEAVKGRPSPTKKSGKKQSPTA